MSPKTILVHLNRASRTQAVLEPIVDLARRWVSHVVGIYLRPGLHAALASQTLSNANAFEAEARTQQKDENEIASIFARMTTNQPFTAEWRAIDAARSDHPEFLLEHAYAADMIIASQSDPDWDRSPFLDCPERLVLGSGRPVLLVPYIGNYREIGRNVVIAWKPGREGARAAFDALPILRTAKSIHVLQVAEADGALPIGASAIATALARHGFKAEVQTSPVSETDVGNEILSRLSDLDADLLVMGAYGHSRLREYVFGGATRQIMQHMTVPTLFSH